MFVSESKEMIEGDDRSWCAFVDSFCSCCMLPCSSASVFSCSALRAYSRPLLCLCACADETKQVLQASSCFLSGHFCCLRRSHAPRGAHCVHRFEYVDFGSQADRNWCQYFSCFLLERSSVVSVHHSWAHADRALRMTPVKLRALIEGVT